MYHSKELGQYLHSRVSYEVNDLFRISDVDNNINKILQNIGCDAHYLFHLAIFLC